MADPIPIRIRDEFASEMATDWQISNGYHFDVGDINEYVEANVSAWPRVMVHVRDERCIDEQRVVNNLLYNLDLDMEILAELKNTGDVDSPDSVKECEKLVEDVKRFVGNHYQMAASGALEIFYKGHRKVYNNNATYPTGVNVLLLIKYRQYRANPNLAG